MKRVAIGIGVLLLVLLAVLLAGWIALQRMDWNRFKEPIAQAAFDATGRRLDLSGDLDLQIGLRPGVRIEGVGFQNAAWGSRPEMARVERLTVRFQLLPLLSGDVLVDRVEVAGLDVLLETRKDGVGNWEFEPPKTASTPAEPPAPAPGKPEAEVPAPEAGEGGESPPLRGFLQHAEIENSVIEMRNAGTGAAQRYAVKRLVARSEDPSSPLELELEAEIGTEPVSLSGTVTGASGVQAGGPLGLDLTVKAGGATLTAKGDIGKPLEASEIALAIGLDAPRLAGLGRVAGADVPDLGPVRLAFALRGGGNAYSLRDLEFDVGSSQLRGQLDVDLSRARPKLDAKLTSTRLDAADFEGGAGASDSSAAGSPAEGAVPSAPAGAAPAASSGGERLFSAEPLPLDALDAADVTLQLDAKELLVGGLAQSDVALSLRLVNRVLQVKRFTSSLYGGRLEANLSLDAAKSAPPLALAGQVRALELGQLLRAQGNEMLAGGPLDLDFHLSGQGGSVRDTMASLSGAFELSMGKAVVNDATAGLLLADLTALEKRARGQGADLHCAYAKLVAQDGIVKPDGIVADLGSIALFGDGKIDLRDERLKLRFDRVAHTVAVSDVMPPVVVKGTLASPEAGIDAGALAVKLVGLGTGLLEGEKPKLAARAGDCRELLARFQEEQRAQGSRKDVARDAATKAADVLGEKTGKEGKKIFDAVKGILEKKP
jgi:hypothetical protein